MRPQMQGKFLLFMLKPAGFVKPAQKWREREKRRREKKERKKGVKGRRERGKEREGKSTAVLLDDAVLLRDSQQTEPRYLVELLTLR